MEQFQFSHLWNVTGKRINQIVVVAMNCARGKVYAANALNTTAEAESFPAAFSPKGLKEQMTGLSSFL
jgi:hypothetical protein